MRKALISIGLIFLATFVYHLDAIYGWWKFNKLCENEGGSRVYEKVVRDVGWLVDKDPYEYLYKGPFSFNDVAFVRWRNKKGEWFDIRIKNNQQPQEPEYQFSTIDHSLQVKYRYQYTSARFADDERFGRTRYEVIEVSSEKLVASHTDFSYEWTKPERMLLSMPTGISCDLKKDTYKNFTQSLYNFK